MFSAFSQSRPCLTLLIAFHRWLAVDYETVRVWLRLTLIRKCIPVEIPPIGVRRWSKPSFPVLHPVFIPYIISPCLSLSTSRSFFILHSFLFSGLTRVTFNCMLSPFLHTAPLIAPFTFSGSWDSCPFLFSLASPPSSSLFSGHSSYPS